MKTENVQFLTILNQKLILTWYQKIFLRDAKIYWNSTAPLKNSPTITILFKVKLEECIAKWQADVAEKDKKIADWEKQCNTAKENASKFEERYGVAKRKIEEVVGTLDEVNGEFR